ncbi:hypothetical protein [Nitrospirillum iridis]|uniref:Uncharacterized protein n=1 Tax=Nitrospirillum iridis TaxID=765888 RepID=A0A7X0EDK6_9PROT|nr:hypothetical protein [Nitrospirillum iridis]MBB6252853.1 hypothetical protein [Nitrospirillum iridis]
MNQTSFTHPEQTLAALGFPESGAGIEFLRALTERDTQRDEAAATSDLPIPISWY